MKSSAAFELPPCLRGDAAVREPPESSDGVWWNERHLQCIWADARLRPVLRTVAGEDVEVIEPGAWNGSGGPDFRNAVVSIGGEVRRGDVEIHVRAGDWFAHGHGGDPAYGGVILHVAWFAPRPAERVPDIPLALLSEAMESRRGFSFSQIDPDAYPRPAGSDVDRPCRNAFAGARPADVAAALSEIGRARLRRKAAEIARRGSGFYEETMAGLGFSRNSAPMRDLAAAVPLAELRARRDPFERYALLLSSAGLLPKEGEAGMPRDYAVRLWAAAARCGTACRTVTVPWATAAVRPLNHPRMRLAAAAALFGGGDALWDAIRALPRVNARTWVKLAAKTFVSAARDASSVLPPRAAAQKGLLGQARINAILVNAVIPLLAAEDGSAWRLLEAVPGEEPGSSMKEMAFRLLGGDHNPAVYLKNALRMQGLLELWRGCASADGACCAGCTLAKNENRHDS